MRENTPVRPEPTKIRRDICETGRRLYQLGFVAANDGNVSARVGPDRVICTPTGVSKGFITEEMLATCDLAGRQTAGRLQISSEIAMHLEIYKMRPDVSAVVHAHPPTATGYAVAGIALTHCALPEVIVSLGRIPLAPYGTPGGTEIAEPIKPYLRDHDAVLMANHGVVTVGAHPLDAHFKMETVEHFARIDLVARQLHGPKGGESAGLNARQVHALRQRFDVQKPVCDLGASSSISTPGSPDPELVDAITREVVRRIGGGD
jgi:L-fuculose-phosphate aldolase